MKTPDDITLDSIRDIKLYQSKKGYRFSIDALLLYSFVDLKYVRKIADMGAGGGVIGILLAGKYPLAKVTLIELQESLVEIAGRNISINGLEGMVNAVKEDIKNLSNAETALRCGLAGFDLVVSNPPFRRPLSGRLSGDDERAIARHELRMKLDDLLAAGRTMLKSKGRFIVIHLPERLAELMDKMRHQSLEPKRLRFVHSNILEDAKMVLIEAVKDGRTGLKVEHPLFVYNVDGGYSDELLGILG